ncbi:MAG: IS4 family transposase [Planctomycetes bacterium]|nr:IS4 family transposase [Planctomycetota bacterium]
MPGSAKGKSKFRRLQDFFCEVRPNYGSVALMIMGFMAHLTGKSLVLSMDRTGWRTRGGHEYNLLVLSVCLGDMGLPILWCDLRKLGNSTVRKRKRLVQRFIRLFGLERIHCLIGDREFIGGEWFRWLREERVPFLMRLRHDIRVANTKGEMTAGKDLFRHLRVGEVIDLGPRRAFKTAMGICATRVRSGELLILGYHAGLDGPTALAMYRQRWNIETGFEKLKTHGFNMESSRLHGGGKIERVLAALSLAAAWSYSG